MECWVPLFKIFLNSPCPETEASLWLTKSVNQSTSSFLSLLTMPTDIDSSSSRVMWIQTLPNAVQARVLSYLLYDCQKFCEKDLCQLAKFMLKDAKEVDFWVKRSAHQLLERLSYLDSEDEAVEEDEFRSLPDWLKDVANDCDLMLPWLPLSQKQFSLAMQFSGSCGENDDDPLIGLVVGKREILDEMIEEVDDVSIQVDDHLNPQVEEMASRLRDHLLSLQSTVNAVEELAGEIQQLCEGGGVKALAVLDIIEPWRADDDTAAVLMSNLLCGNDDEFGWPSHVLCSVILPKLLVLKEPASRVLLTTTLEYCKVHQRAAEYALLLPLILRKEGINNPICDAITRIVRESLHPGHVSAFCHKLLCDKDHLRKFICLPSNQYLISSKLVWTESLFNLMQNILNHNVHLTQDSVDTLVHRAWESAYRFSKSLKFGNFLLCFVTKCAPLSKSQRSLLLEATQRTNSLVTKSVLSKLASL